MEQFIQEEQLSKKERRALRREARKKEESRAASKKKFSRIAWWIGGIAALVIAVFLIFYGFNAKEKSSGTVDKSIAVPEMSRNHIQTGSHFDAYNSNPPTSGPHWPDDLDGGAYKEEQADEALVHNLEHGHIWISYHPRISEGIKKELEKFGSRKVVVTPRSKNDTDIALAAWERLDKFNIEGGILDKKRIEDFIARYMNKGPEFIP